MFIWRNFLSENLHISNEFVTFATWLRNIIIQTKINMDTKKKIIKSFNEEINVLANRLSVYTDYGYSEELEPIVKILLEAKMKLKEAKDEFLTKN